MEQCSAMFLPYEPVEVVVSADSSEDVALKELKIDEDEVGLQSWDRVEQQ